MRPSDALRQRLDTESVGFLEVEGPDGDSLRVHVMQGEILAAESESDGAEVLRRLVNAGHIMPHDAQRLRRQLGNVTQLGDVLFGVAPDLVLAKLFSGRFHENLGRFLLAQGPVRFKATEGVLVENLQVGHDSMALLEELESAVLRIEPGLIMADSFWLEEGQQPPASAEQALVLAALRGGATLSQLFLASPFESIRTAMHVVAMMDAGVLAAPERPASPPRSSHAAPHQAPSAPEPGPLLDEAERKLLPHDPGDYAEPVFVDEGSADQGEGAVMEFGGSASEQERVGDELLAGDEIQVFQDHDHSRGASGDGIFSVSGEFLEKVDLSAITSFVEDEAEDEPILIEMEDGEEAAKSGKAVTLSFSSPPLTEKEAESKVQVTNEVLRQICLALDEEKGGGTGQASIQLLLESAPASFGTLFVNVDASRDGAMDEERVLSNLDRRPETERRRVLNCALRDLIERGFSLSMEYVSEDRLESMLESIAGYQKRIGL